jgi:hypothetical protein
MHGINGSEDNEYMVGGHLMGVSNSGVGYIGDEGEKLSSASRNSFVAGAH